MNTGYMIALSLARNFNMLYAQGACASDLWAVLSSQAHLNALFCPFVQTYVSRGAPLLLYSGLISHRSLLLLLQNLIQTGTPPVRSDHGLRKISWTRILEESCNALQSRFPLGTQVRSGHSRAPTS